MPPLPKGALLAGGKRLAPTEADSGDRTPLFVPSKGERTAQGRGLRNRVG